MFRMVKSETDVCLHSLLKDFERVTFRLLERSEFVFVQVEKGLFAQAVQYLALVLEVGVNRSRRILNLGRDLAHRNALVALPHEKLAGGIQDFPLQHSLLPRFTMSHSHIHTV